MSAEATGTPETTLRRASGARVPLVLLVLATVGILDAAYLTYAHLFGTAACGVASGCGAVMASRWSAPYGIPLSALGLGLYLAIALGSWRALRATDPHRHAESLRWVSLLALLAALPTLLLIYLQGAVIRAWCPFCLLSAALVFSILIVSWWQRKRTGALRPMDSGGQDSGGQVQYDDHLTGFRGFRGSGIIR